MMEHFVPVCHATSMPIGGSSKLGSRITLIHAHSTTPEIVAPCLCSETHPDGCNRDLVRSSIDEHPECSIKLGIRFP